MNVIYFPMTLEPAPAHMAWGTHAQHHQHLGGLEETLHRQLLRIPTTPRQPLRLGSVQTNWKREHEPLSWTSLDVGMTHMDTTIQEEHMVSLFLCTFSNFENKFLPKKIIIIRNNKEAQEVFGETWRRRIPARASNLSRRPTTYQILLQLGVLD
jgi:hypothetical protein